MKPVYIISDLHLRAQRPDLNQSLEAFIEHIFTPDSDTLYILGDLFEYWIGDDGAAQLGYSAQVNLLGDLVKKGKQVYFMHGNRDFLVGEQFSSTTGVEILPDPFILDLAGKTCLLKHGDDLCTDDVEHQKFRTLTRNPDWQKSILEKSIPERLQIASQMRQMSGSTRKPSQIMDVNEQSVRQTITEHGVDILIHGHTHRPGRLTYELNGKTVERIVLGDWDQGVSYLKVDDRDFELVTIDG